VRIIIMYWQILLYRWFLCKYFFVIYFYHFSFRRKKKLVSTLTSNLPIVIVVFLWFFPTIFSYEYYIFKSANIVVVNAENSVLVNFWVSNVSSSPTFATFNVKPVFWWIHSMLRYIMNQTLGIFNEIKRRQNISFLNM
jgi:signal transduction histidine kinase